MVVTFLIAIQRIGDESGAVKARPSSPLRVGGPYSCFSLGPPTPGLPTLRLVGLVGSIEVAPPNQAMPIPHALDPPVNLQAKLTLVLDAQIKRNVPMDLLKKL